MSPQATDYVRRRPPSLFRQVWLRYGEAIKFTAFLLTVFLFSSIAGSI